MSRLVVSLVGFLFAALGVGFWVAPEEAGQVLHLEAIGVAGLSTLRADLGGVFVGLAVLCWAGAWTRRRSLLIAAALVLVSVVVGRVIGLATNGWADGVLPALLVEVGAIVALALCAVRLRPPAGPGPPGRPRRALVAGAIAVVVGAGIATVLLHPGLQQWVFERAALRLTARPNTAPLADDALRVAICGSSAPLPSPRRAKACVAVFAGGKLYVVDVGPESVETLMLWGIPLAEVAGVLLTHFHSDHIGDLGELHLQTWARGRPAPLPVYGGPGVEQVVEGFNLAYRQDQGYRTAHHTARLMPPETWGMVARPVELVGPPTPAKDRTGLVLDAGGLRITAIEVDHAPVTPAYAFRFDYKGRSAVITGDAKLHPPLTKAAAGVDLLVSEAIARPMVKALEAGARASGQERTARIMHDIQDYHVSPEEVAAIANDARVRLLVFYHLLPAPDGFLARRVFARGVSDARRGDWTIADDGSLYTLPLGSDAVRIGRVGR
jgi:ribonuclease Z